MAYKFQFGTARLSGALEQEGHVRVAGSDKIGVATGITSTDYYAGLSYDASTESGKLEIASGSGDTLFSVDTKLSGAVMNTLAGSGLAFNQSTGALSVDLNEATAGNVDVSADSFTFIDASGNTKKDSYVDYATAIAGGGLAASAGGLAVNVSGAAVIASDKVGISGSIAGDGLAYAGGVNSISGLSVNVDGTGIELSSDSLQLKDNGVTLAKMAGITRGSIISGDASGDPQYLAKGAASTFLQSDGTDLAYVAMSGDATLSAGAITIAANAVTVAKIEQVAGNSLLVRDDASEGNLSEFALATTQLMIGDGSGFTAAALSGDVTMTNAGVVSIGATRVTDTMMNDDVAAGLAGAGLTAASGQLAVDGNSVTSKDFSGAFSLASGYNYSDGTAMGGSIIATLPAPTENGQMISIKAPSDCSGTNYVTIAGGTIDGESTHRLESPYAAITLICVDSVSDIWILI